MMMILYYMLDKMMWDLYFEPLYAMMFLSPNHHRDDVNFLYYIMLICMQAHLIILQVC